MQTKLSRRAALAGATALATGAAVNTVAASGYPPASPENWEALWRAEERASALATPTREIPQLAIDPIFAVIERHRAAHMHAMACSRVRSETVDVSWSPDYDPVKVADADRADRAAHARDADAAMALLAVEPTTVAGMAALLGYVLDFNAGALRLPDEPGWCSIPTEWPCDTLVDEDEIDIGAEAGAPFAWALIEKVALFLKAQTVAL